MHLLISEILELLEKATSKKEKIDILKRYEAPVLRGILRINFDPTVKMDLPEGEPPFKKEVDRPRGMSPTTLQNEYRRFYIWVDPKTNLSKIKKESLFIELLESIDVSEAEVVCLAKDKKLHKKYKSLKEDVVREAFPFTLPPKEQKVKTELPN